MKFKVGDIVVGNALASRRYNITKEGWKGRVISTRADTIRVVDINDSDDSCSWTVLSEYFDLARRENMNNDETVICLECGCVLEPGQATLVDGQYYCEDCLDELFVECQCCGEYVKPEDVVDIDGEEICTDCRDSRSRFYQCDDCGEWHNSFITDYVRTADGSKVCNECYEDHYHTCYRCDRIFLIDDLEYEDGDYYCADCQRIRHKAIHEYSYKPNPVFKTGTHDVFYTSSSIKELLFGVELEIDDGYDAEDCAQEIVDVSEDVYCKHDGSLDDGVEIVSHPCSLSYHLNDLGWDEICSTARDNGFSGEEAGTCGLHIHVGRDQLGSTDKARGETAAKLVLLVDRHWETLVKFSRRSRDRLNEWARRPDVRLYNCRSEEDLIQAAKRTRNDGRYQAVNLENYNTVEFRLFNSTLYPSELYASLELVSNICTYAMKHSVMECMKSAWADIVSVAECEYLDKYLENQCIYNGEETRDWKVADESVPAVKVPTVGDRVVVINDDGTDVSALREHIGEEATVIIHDPDDYEFGYAIAFDHSGVGVHHIYVDGRDNPFGYWVHPMNIRLVA